jgi:hypothetical protein
MAAIARTAVSPDSSARAFVPVGRSESPARRSSDPAGVKCWYSKVNVGQP